MWLAEQTFTDLRHAAHDLRLAAFGAHGQIHPRVLQILVVIDRRGVNEGLDQLQRQRDEVAGHHGFEQQAQLCRRDR